MFRSVCRRIEAQLRLIGQMVGAVVCFVLVTPAHADIIFTMTPGPGGTVDMNIQASGTVSASGHTWLLIGDPVADSFLVSGAASVVGGAPVPALTLDGVSAQNNFHRDDNGSAFNGVQSLLGFFFGFGGLSGTLDLSDLIGDYNLPGSVFADFVLGTHTGLVPGASTSDHLQNLGNVTVIVRAASTVPEPGTLALLGFGIASLIATRRRKQ